MGRNIDMLFAYKAVLDACFTTAIAYGGETWLGGKQKPLSMHYTRVLKSLLGVRAMTCMDLHVYLMELNYPSFQV